MIDADDYAKEDCACGHRRHSHRSGTGPCRRTRTRQDYSNLPPREYAPGDENNPFAWPMNWPAISDIPLTEVPCGCAAFYDYEPDFDGADL